MVIDYSQTVNRFSLLDAYPLPNIDEHVSAIAKGSLLTLWTLSTLVIRYHCVWKIVRLLLLKQMEGCTNILVYRSA